MRVILVISHAVSHYLLLSAKNYHLIQAWERLERAEHERERVLRDELIRQEKLEQMARRFDRKAAMRETWLVENQKLLAQVNYVANML